MFYVDKNQKANFSLPFAFPLVVNETFLKDRPMGFNDWHWHEEVQLSYVLDGGMITTAQGTDYILRPGDGFFINSNVSHMTRPTSIASAHYLSLNIHPSLLTLFHGSVVEQKYFLPYLHHPNFQFVHLTPETIWQEQLLMNIRYLFHILTEKPFGYELDAYSYLLHIWKELLERLEVHQGQTPVVERPEAQQIMAYLRSNFHDTVTLGQIAENVHLSEEECCRLFKSTYRCTIFTYLTDYRLQHGIRLLPDRSLSVSEIAERCGFNSTSYFIKRFREKVGMSPLQYRNSGLSAQQAVFGT